MEPFTRSYQIMYTLLNAPFDNWVLHSSYNIKTCLNCIKDSASFNLHPQCYMNALVILNKNWTSKDISPYFHGDLKTNFVPWLLIAFDLISENCFKGENYCENSNATKNN